MKHISPTILGSVKGGKFVADDHAMFKRAFYSHEGRKVSVTVKRFTKRRSDPQNAFYWGVVVKMIGEQIGESDPQTVHEYLKAVHNYRIQAIGNKEIRIPQSTANLTTVEFQEYLDRVTRWAADFLALYIPEPGEVAA